MFLKNLFSNIRRVNIRFISVNFGIHVSKHIRNIAFIYLNFDWPALEDGAGEIAGMGLMK